MSVLETVVPGQIWSVLRRVRMGPLVVRCRSTIVKLSDDGLWVCSPPRPTSDLLDALATIGPVRHVVAPNLQHHRFFGEFLASLPDAEGRVAPGLPDKVPALRSHPTLGELDWAGELDGIFVEGLPVLNETVWVHRATGTLIVTDLLFDFGADNPPLLRLIARLLGVDGRLGMSRTMKLAVKDRAALGRAVERIAGHRIDRVITAHDHIVSNDAQEQLTAAFAWLQR